MFETLDSVFIFLYNTKKIIANVLIHREGGRYLIQCDHVKGFSTLLLYGIKLF
jgi:hypothetical protein